ncbi:hypothetical protein A374_16803 [Fictibacillus macauensis ZFHKF-1]|uniref:GIY-YIG domain-containing protein n=1 Tax=Fictibacillus macauensis ZFHKF-1 TaxID=1196324 RepID=I8AF04_9BACL|nr:GIY-YIG nuclease family protein [Fictibacillus macauensis]EIT84202.1 hypothetical protein A374_16803 [Fictibacillus macauensis ZFHKF-1]
MGNSHYVYMIRCGDGTLYTGYATDVQKRFSMHERGKGAKYTRGRGPLVLVYEQAYCSKEEAMKAEYAIKQLSKRKKEQFIKKGATPRVCTEELS